MRLAERDDAAALRCHVHFVLGSCSQAYGGNHLRTCIPLLQRAFELGLESGDMLFSTFAASSVPEIMFMVGDPIDAVHRETELRERALRGSHDEQRLIELRIVRQTMLCLLGETRGRASLTTDEIDEAAIVASLRAARGFVVPGVYYMLKTILLTLFGEYREAVQTILGYDQAIETSQSAAVRVTEYAFYACLAITRGLRDPSIDRRAVRRILEKWRGLLGRWAESAPMNFRHKRDLVDAELADRDGRLDDASRLYESAIGEATANGFHHHAALASELAGLAFARHRSPNLARTYLEAARAGYSRWGAAGKVRALDEAYPELAPRAVPSGLVRGVDDSFDALGVIRASQALSSEIALPALLQRLMRVIVQASGARRGTLLVDADGRLRIEAHFDAQRDELSIPADGGIASELVSEAIVRSTLRTGEDVVLAHASAHGEFTRDAYVAAHSSKSILCLAVRHRDRVLGALFLENDLSTGAFIEARLDMLRLLVAQAANLARECAPLRLDAPPQRGARRPGGPPPRFLRGDAGRRLRGRPLGPRGLLEPNGEGDLRLDRRPERPFRPPDDRLSDLRVGHRRAVSARADAAPPRPPW